jgi:hypothetical protein
MMISRRHCRAVNLAAFTPSCLVKTAQPLFADVQAVEVPVFFGAGSGIFA